jgi:endonuclease/exonuclease/phosphatase (EEP) superfamily protein YafD
MKWFIRFLRSRVGALIAFLVVLFTFITILYWQVLSLPISGQLALIKGDIQSDALHCYHNEKAKPLDKNGKLELLVWNIYKQKNVNWQEKLMQYSSHTALALLQEVSMTDEFKEYVSKANWYASHVDAFKLFDVSSGVLNLSIRAPMLACAYIEAEPWLQLPKSGIFARYKLSDGRVLAVVNLHSVNFDYDTLAYNRQISTLAAELITHEGPVIFAGDLNTWSAARVEVINAHLSKLGLRKVEFSPDNRTRFVNGLALDHVYYRGLTLVKASSPVTDASDHNPMLVSFSITF